MRIGRFLRLTIAAMVFADAAYERHAASERLTKRNIDHTDGLDEKACVRCALLGPYEKAEADARAQFFSLRERNGRR